MCWGGSGSPRWVLQPSPRGNSGSGLYNDMNNKPYDCDEDDDQRSFLQRHRVAFVVAFAVAGLAGTAVFKIVTGHGSSANKAPETLMVKLPPMPTPPPPAPTPPPPEPDIPQEQKMMTQDPVDEDEKKPEPAKPDQPPPSVGTGIVGDGKGDAFGLGPAGKGSGNWLGNGVGNGGSHSRFGWYASQVQTKVGEALRNNRRTRGADLQIEVRIWPDPTGRITRAKVAGSTGDGAVDSAIQNEVLAGLQLQEPPPQGMPLPIILRIVARHAGGVASRGR